MMTLIRLIVRGGVLCLFLLVPLLRAETVMPKRILVVYEEQASTPSHTEMEQSLVSILNRSLPIAPEIYRESLDLARFPGLREQSIQWIRTKYAQRPIDFVVYVGNRVDPILPGVPTVYCGNASQFKEAEARKAPQDSFFPLYMDIANTLERITHIHPEARKLYLIAATDDTVYRDEAIQEILTFKSSLQFQDLSSLSVAELRDLLRKENEKTLVLFLSYTRGPAGDRHLSRDVIAELAPISRAPIYGGSDTFLGTGVVGGYVTSWPTIGSHAAEAVLRRLRGESPIEERPNKWQKWIFDWRQVRRWHIDEREIPSDAVILYRNPSFWDLYRGRVFAAAVVIALESLLIVILLRYRHRQMQAQRELRDLAGNLIKMQDDNRRKIAQDLQEQIGQELIGISLCLGQVLANYRGSGSEDERLLSEAHSASRKVVEELQSVAYLLDPPRIDGNNLGEIMRAYLAELGKRTSCQIQFEIGDVGELSTDVEQTLFRIVQVSLVNVMRHAHANAVMVRMDRRSNYVYLGFEDNGLGTRSGDDWASMNKTSFGIGLAGVRERVNQLGGDFQVQSSSTGTAIRVTMPVEG